MNPSGHVEVRKWIADFFQPHIAAFRDSQGAGEHVRRVFEDALHFVMTLDEKFRALELHAIGVLNRLAGLDAQHHVLGVSVVLAEIVAVVGRHHGKAKIFFQAEQVGMDAMLLLQTLVLNLQKKVVRAKNVTVDRGSGAGRVVVIFHQALGHFAFQAARESDQPLGVFGKKFLAHPRLVVETTQRGFRRDLRQIAVAFFVFRQHQKMVIGVTVGRRALDVVVVFLADVKFAADNRLHPGLVGCVYKVDRAENIAVVGHGDRRHAQFFHALDKLFHVAGAVKHGVVGMEMQVDELRHGWLRCSYSNGKLQRRNGEFIHRRITRAGVPATTLNPPNPRGLFWHLEIYAAILIGLGGGLEVQPGQRKFG